MRYRSHVGLWFIFVELVVPEAVVASAEGLGGSVGG